MSEPAPSALRVELFVADVERSVTFYRRVLGFADDAPGHSHSHDYVSMRRGGAVLGIGRAGALPDDHPAKPLEGQAPGRGVEIVLEIPDVEAAYHHALDAGHPLSSELERQPWGLLDFRLTDPDGYYLRVTELLPR